MRRLALAALCLLLTAVLCSCASAPALPPADETLLEASEGLDEIFIDAAFDPEENTLRVRQRLTLTNRTGEALNAAVLRTWPNAFQSVDTSPCAQEERLFDLYYPDGFSSGALVMARVQANGETVVYRYTDAAKTSLSIPVPGGWLPQQDVVLDLEYAIQIPHMAYRFGEMDGIWALGNAFAIPAVWEDGAFRTDAYAPVGDPFVSDCANYTVSVTVPQAYLCAGSAYPATEASDGLKTFRFSAPAVRDFALVISREFQTAQRLQDGVLVTAYASQNAQEMLKYACKALKCYEKRYGSYPYQSFTLAQVHFPYGGMEYPSLTMVSSEMLETGGRELEYLIAHETAHQWWYAAVGSDGWNQPWQDEALCEFSLLEYAQDTYGQAARDELEYARAQSAMRVTVPQGVTPGAPLSAFSSMSEYSLVVYDRGAACLIALDKTIPGGLDSFLREYYQRYAFRRASRTHFEDLLAQSTGEDLAPLLRDYLDTYILN